MKILVRNDATPGQRNTEQANLGQGGFSIPNSSITWLSIIYIVVSILANTISSLVSYIPQKDTDNKTFELRRSNFQIQMLQRVLEMENENDRRASIELLIGMGLVDNNNKSVSNLDVLRKLKYIPKWQPRVIEVFSSYATGQNANSSMSTGNPNGVQTGSPPIPPRNIQNSNTGVPSGSFPR